MNTRKRRIILCLVILFFILITPVIILYSLGYSFDWQEKEIVLTGGLYIKSVPKKATVYINNKPKKETPVFIKRLVPKYYQIKVSKEDFHEWNKKLKIESKLVTEIKDIVLIPITPEIKVINKEIPNNFSLKEYIASEIPATNDIFYIQKQSYILYKTNKTNSFQEQINLTPLPEDQEYEIIVSNDQQIAVLSNDNQLYVLNKETRDFELIKENVQQAQFSYDNKKLLYYTPNEIWIYHLNNNEETREQELITRLSQEIQQAIWYKTNKHIIFLVNQKIKIIELDSRDKRNIVDIIEIDAQEIAYSEKNQILYLIKNKELIGISLE